MRCWATRARLPTHRRATLTRTEEVTRPSRPSSTLAPSTLALAWLLSRPGVTAPVVGPRTLEQLTGALPALDVELSQETETRLDELFPGPGGEAPDAYTWP